MLCRSSAFEQAQPRFNKFEIASKCQTWCENRNVGNCIPLLQLNVTRPLFTCVCAYRELGHETRSIGMHMMIDRPVSHYECQSLGMNN